MLGSVKYLLITIKDVISDEPIKFNDVKPEILCRGTTYNPKYINSQRYWKLDLNGFRTYDEIQLKLNSEIYKEFKVKLVLNPKQRFHRIVIYCQRLK